MDAVDLRPMMGAVEELGSKVKARAQKVRAAIMETGGLLELPGLVNTFSTHLLVAMQCQANMLAWYHMHLEGLELDTGLIKKEEYTLHVSEGFSDALWKCIEANFEEYMESADLHVANCHHPCHSYMYQEGNLPAKAVEPCQSLQGRALVKGDESEEKLVADEGEGNMEATKDKGKGKEKETAEVIEDEEDADAEADEEEDRNKMVELMELED
ncbi:hypothetical protein M422DRAFT_247253 [Sphaerobolus stellatus SS14]|nr:hypothetical protein M422DRAFT_247253 [Sphaerobolus stellatus SS14]